jgi:hypothetical protein
MYPEGAIGKPATPRVAGKRLEDRYRASAGRSQLNTFRAENFDVLYDSP